MSKQRTDNHMKSDLKNDRLKKSQFLRDLEQIQLQRHSVERERIGYMYEKHEKQYSHLQHIERSLNEEIKAERLKIEQQLTKIQLKVNEFQQDLKNVKSTPQFVENLKLSMETIESNINDFKTQQRQVFESLMLSEKETEQEIVALEGKISALSMSTASSVVSARSIKPHTNFKSSNLPKEVTQFEAFIAKSGGMQGGWDDYDHGAFLRIRERFHGKPAFVEAAVCQIPGRNKEDILQHEKWYQQFLEMKDKKKEAIAIWRNEKKKENLEPSDVLCDEANERARRQKEQIMKNKLQQEREANKQQLKVWKAEKQKQLRLEEEKKLLQEKREKTLEKKRNKEMEAARQIAKVLLQEKREEEERMRWMQELEEEQMKQEKQQEARQRIAQFQIRDRMVLSMKQSEQQKKQEEEDMKKARLDRARLKVNVHRDPSRLYKLTEGWKHRKKDSSDRHESGAMLHMPHRAVPTWRQNL